MEDFDELLRQHRPCAQRYIRYHLPPEADVEDVLQETCLTAYRRFATLRDEEAFRPWLLSIARNACRDWYRARRLPCAPLEEAAACGYLPRALGPHRPTRVEETLESMQERDRQVLWLVYGEQLPQQEVARRLHVPLGTVKSRLHTARERFRAAWTEKQGGSNMKKLPEKMPDYTIRWMEEAPFDVVWEELPGWLAVPRLGEKVAWAMYDDPSRKKTWQYELKVLGEAEVHGLRGVELEARCAGIDPTGRSNPSDTDTTHFVAQLTDKVCRYLACVASKDGVKRLVTFLDVDAFMPNWGLGENNCGNDIHPKPKGLIRREAQGLTCPKEGLLMDVVGRCQVTLGGTTYDTICVVDIESYNDGTLVEQFIGRDGRTVLWRRFNRDNWETEEGGPRWSERLPDSERLMVNGECYVHWYDCLTDRVGE